jgi:hypothetical protein
MGLVDTSTVQHATTTDYNLQATSVNIRKIYIFIYFPFLYTFLVLSCTALFNVLGPFEVDHMYTWYMQYNKMVSNLKILKFLFISSFLYNWPDDHVYTRSKLLAHQ